MPRRKITQITHASNGDLIALCNDGTVWTIIGAGQQWVMWDDIPQGDIPAGTTINSNGSVPGWDDRKPN